ncbi:MAG: sigma-54-dependent transcriptional regulator [Myxococcota bacterium]
MTLEREIERRIVGRSAAMQEVRGRVLALSRLQVPVLVRGDAGTGRTHVARALHAASGASGGPLCVAGNGEAAPAIARKTVLLEEVAALAPTDQARWLALLRRSEGGEGGAPLRILATTAHDLGRAVREGALSPELREQLERFTLELPPLRDRTGDVADLARALGDRAAGRMGRPRVDWTREALRLLAAQSWPGNVRELASLVDRLVAFDSDGRIGRGAVARLLAESPVGVASSRRTALRRQRDELAHAIDETGGNLAEVARRLNMSRGGVIYRAQKFGLLPRKA